MLQVDRTSEEGNGGRGHNDRLMVRIEGLRGDDSKGMEEWKLARVEFRECHNVLPVVSHEFEIHDLLSVRGDQ